MLTPQVLETLLSVLWAYDASDTENDNIAIGHGAMTENTAGGTKNIAIGVYAMDALTSGDDNTGLGYAALGALNTGSANVGIGNNALDAHTSGNYNTAVGYGALTTNTTADKNTAVGANALQANSTGTRNTAIGNTALYANLANDNLGIGDQAGYSITTGTRNIAIGINAYDDSDTESDNLAIGYNAMTTNTAGGTGNTAIGNYALDELTSGDHNVSVGLLSGNSMTEGVSNVLLGNGCGANITTGDENIMIGRNVGSNNVNLTTGHRNVIIGAYADVSAAGSDNQIAIGYDVSCSGDSNFTFGNGGTDSNIAFGATSISAPSDIRLKQNINDDVAGLSFINDLRPVTYEWRKEKDIPEEMNTHVAGSEERFNNDFVNHGFIAQEVKEVIDNHPEIKDGFKMWFEDDVDGRQRIAEGALVPMLVKAVQELSAKNDSLETSNQALIARIEALENA